MPDTENNYRDMKSIISLATMSIAAIFGFFSLMQYGFWYVGIFLFTIIGGVGGLLWELFGDMNGQINETVSGLRKSNVGLVMAASISTYYLINGILWTNLTTFLVSIFASFLFVEGFFGMASPVRYMLLLLVQHGMEIALMVCSSVPFNAKTYLILSSITNMLSFILPTVCKPLTFLLGESGTFHTLNTISVVLTFCGLNYVQNMSEPSTISLVWTLGGIIVGFILAIFTSRIQRNYLRFVVVNYVWKIIYKILLSTSFPPPDLEMVSQNKKIKWIPYYKKYPLAEPLDVLSTDTIPNSQMFGKLGPKVVSIFKLISFLDRYMPQSDISTPLKYKAKINIDRSPEYYVPTFVKILGNKNQFIVPLLLEEHNLHGQAAAWMASYSHCSSIVSKLEGEPYGCTHIIDLTWMEKYKPKDDFFGYGGKAYFHMDCEKNIFKLKFVTFPGNPHDLIAADPLDPEFRKADQSFLSSTGIINVAGFHLAGIHMLFNLVTISLINSFVIGQDDLHPLYAVMNVHFYNHSLVEEITTAHLMEKGAVFNQIFALSHTDICNFVGDYFKNIDFGKDADIESKQNIFGAKIPNSQLDWQTEYKEIFMKYANKVVDAIYGTEEQIKNDNLLKNFYEELDSALKERNRGQSSGLSDERYGKLDEKKFLVRFIADCMHTVIILHKVYGTKVPQFAVHAKLFPSQIPINGSAPSYEDYMSMLLVTAATSRIHFSPLLSVDTNKVFGSVKPSNTKNLLVDAFNEMKNDLYLLGEKWSKEPFINENYQRCLPDELECGAGY
ncbi:MAG: hypothetical protein Satyrvirus1_8 [Satyrvirus sp.]|uniref:Uncharacterized protein n=1 Tax=Satyrvirus sp. TaxID=2487771 RepID=A0A3G5ACP3_9VIRU|nr:MAG: hypothetical protein Satyrvirus1_8 [Satyrvirus sp.]